MGSTELRYLAFDLGGSGGRLTLGLFDGERLRLEKVHRFDNRPVALNDCLYWDIFYIYEQLKLGIGKAMTQAGPSIRSAGIDSFCNDHAFVDERGELLTPLRCYRDKRTVRHGAAIYAKMAPERLYGITGNQIAPFNTLMQLAAMREAGQGYILDKAHRLLFVPDLLAYFMTGSSVCEYTLASVSQIYDQVLGDWSEEILGAFDIPRRLFGEIVQPGTRIGKTKASWNRELGIAGLDLVAVCEHDTASAFLAATSVGDRAILSSGTWSIVGTEVAAPLIEPLGLRFNIANEGGPPGHHRLLRNVMGLWIVQELARAQGSGDYARLEAEAAASLPFAYRIEPDDPAFFSPTDMEAAIVGHCLDSGRAAPATKAETLRCVYESLALKYRWALEKIETLAGRDFSRIDVVGGGSKNRLLCQFTANASGKIVVAGPADATTLGNILVQLLADGRIGSIDEGRALLRASFPLEEYHPENVEAWNAEYAAFTGQYALD